MIKMHLMSCHKVHCYYKEWFSLYEQNIASVACVVISGLERVLWLLCSVTCDNTDIKASVKDVDYEV